MWEPAILVFPDHRKSAPQSTCMTTRIRTRQPDNTVPGFVRCASRHRSFFTNVPSRLYVLNQALTTGHHRHDSINVARRHTNGTQRGREPQSECRNGEIHTGPPPSDHRLCLLGRHQGRMPRLFAESESAPRPASETWGRHRHSDHILCLTLHAAGLLWAPRPYGTMEPWSRPTRAPVVHRKRTEEEIQVWKTCFRKRGQPRDRLFGRL